MEPNLGASGVCERGVVAGDEAIVPPVLGVTVTVAVVEVIGSNVVVAMDTNGMPLSSPAETGGCWAAVAALICSIS